jgi:hypothetical protein
MRTLDLVLLYNFFFLCFLALPIGGQDIYVGIYSPLYMNNSSKSPNVPPSSVGGSLKAQDQEGYFGL